MLIHREALELARNTAEPGDGTPMSITCLRVDENGAVTATDRHLWLRMQAAVDEPSLFDELAEKGAGAESDGPVLVPADVMSAFNAAMKKRKKTKDGPVAHVVVSQKGKHVTLASSDGKTKRTFLLDAVEVDYPNVDKTVAAPPHVTQWCDKYRSMAASLASTDCRKCGNSPAHHCLRMAIQKIRQLGSKETATREDAGEPSSVGGAFQLPSTQDQAALASRCRSVASAGR